jgi:hypothetical protein
MNIGQLITYLILNSTKTNSEILEIVHSKFECKTTMACVAWYKSKLRKEGKIAGGKTQRQQVVMTEDELVNMCK